MKIEANELMLGNLVFSKETQENQIINGIDTEYVYLDCITFDYQTLEDIEPIPLTEEWLMKFGCIVYEFDHKENQYGLDDRLFMIRDGVVCDYASNVKLPHVHTFQNFIFALTQKELTI